MATNPIKGVIFDFNGTLLFDTPQHEQAWREYAHKLCGREITEDDFRYHIHGRTNAEILRYFLGDSLTEREIARHGEEKEAVYRRLCLAMGDRFHLADGDKELLDALKRGKVPMAVATSSGRSNAQFYIKRFDLWNWFNQNTFLYNEGEYPSKPAPDMYLAAAEAIGLAPSECVIFEDMPSGIEAARTAGAGAIVAVASSADRAFFASLGVDRVIGDFTEVGDLYGLVKANEEV